MTVCSIDSEECMLGQCDDCPGEEILTEFLIQKLQDVETVSCSQWTTVDRTNLIKIEQPVEHFIEDLVDDLMGLKYHHFVTKKQSGYYKHLKEHLKEDECLITCDFAQNYTSTIQDELLVVVPTSYAVISSDLKHDAAATNIFIENVLVKVANR